MAGMLPGVECARRRRCYQGGGISDSPTAASHSSRRSSFCLYRSNHDTHLSSSFSLQRNIINQAYCHDEKLGGVARQAKERLDEKLKKERNLSENHRSKQRLTRGVNERSSMGLGNLQTEVFGLKKSGSKRFINWAKFSWKASDQEECAVCLECFKAGETLVHLPCAHRFHSRCLVPWLENNAHCPCCRMGLQSFPS